MGFQVAKKSWTKPRNIEVSDMSFLSFLFFSDQCLSLHQWKHQNTHRCRIDEATVPESKSSSGRVAGQAKGVPPADSHLF